VRLASRSAGFQLGGYALDALSANGAWHVVRTLERCRQLAPSEPLHSYRLAALHCFLTEHDRAFELLEGLRAVAFPWTKMERAYSELALAQFKDLDSRENENIGLARYVVRLARALHHAGADLAYVVALAEKDLDGSPISELRASHPSIILARQLIAQAKMIASHGTHEMPEWRDLVARYARTIWEREGCPEGRAMEHWQRAERELVAEPRRS
jgi:hypothetical protein